MVVDRHHEVLNGVGVREQADLAADGSIFLLLRDGNSLERSNVLPPLSTFFFFYLLRRASRTTIS